MGTKFRGLDIGAAGIKAVEITRPLQGYRVTNFWFYPLRGTARQRNREEELQVLGEIFPPKRKMSEGLVLAVASDRTMVHPFTPPFPQRKKNLKVLKFEVEPLLPMAADDVVVDYYPVKGREGANANREALVFAVPKSEIRDDLDLLKQAGVDPESMIPEAVALFWAARHLRKQDPRENEAEAVLDLGAEKATLVIYQGEDLIGARSILYGGALGSRAGDPEMIDREEMTTFAGNQEAEPFDEVLDRLVAEVLRVLAHYETGLESQKVGNLFLTGGLAQYPRIQEKLGERFHRSVEILDVGAEPALAAVPPEKRHSLVVAFGSALWGMAAEERRINFRQGEFAWAQKAQREKNRLNLVVAYTIILAVLGISLLATQLYLKEKRYKDFKKEIRQEFLQASPGTKRVVNELQQMKGLVQEEKSRLDALGGAGGSSSPLEIFREISLQFDPGLKIRITEMVMNPESVEVSGEADALETVNRLKAKLEHDPHYQDVQLKTVQSSVVDNVIEFKLQMKRGT